MELKSLGAKIVDFVHRGSKLQVFRS